MLPSPVCCLAVGVSLLAAGCPPINITQPAPSRPLVTARPGTALSPVVFAGFIYPVDGAADTYEVDVPLVTDLPGTPAQVSYFAFEINYQLGGVRNLELTWRAAGTATTIRKVDSPCDDAVAMSAHLALMRSTSARQTGRREVLATATSPRVGVPASFSLGIDRLLESGTPVWWVTCNENESGEVIGPGQATVDYNVAILLPTALVPPSGGSLEAVAANLADAQRSAPTALTVVPSPALIGVAGDSVAWGQGVADGAKYFRALAAALPTAPASAITGGTTAGAPRVVVKAHSGERITSNAATIAGATGCRFGLNPLASGASSGEIPGRGQNVPCQIRDMTTQTCAVTLPPGPAPPTPPDLGAVTPTFACSGPAGASPVTLDLGPRFDFVFVNGCINDLGPVAILLGLNGFFDPATQTAAANRFCDVRRSLPDIRTSLPNAVIDHFGYHNILSNLSDTSGLGCLAPPPSAVLGITAPTAPLPACAGFAIDDPASVLCLTAVAPVQRIIAARAARFLADSDAMLALSIGAVAATPADGRGSYMFTRLPFTPANAFLGPASQTWGLTCAGPSLLGPVDPVAAARAGGCAAAFGVGTRGDEFCRRASAFHPDTTGNATIATAIRGDLTVAGLFRRP